jgi:glycosyltransferase involved in cell wall biosynthesis
MIKVAFNAVALLSPLTGIGQYAKSLLTELDASTGVAVNKFYAKGWSREIRQQGLSAPANLVKQWVRKFVPNSYALSRAVQQHYFSRGVRSFKPDLYHEPNFLAYRFDGPSVITVHDLSWIRYPEMHPIERVRAMDKYFEPGLRRASRIITDSAFVKQELVDVFGVDPSTVHPVYLGVEHLFVPLQQAQTQAVLQAHGLVHGQYWLAVGTLEPRKNLQLALRAFMQLPQRERQACPLILVGMRGWNTGKLEQQLQPLVAAGEVRQLGYISREDLAVVMAGAKALIYPSVYEGFGLPPLEAMACGVPVIASNVSSLPEVVGDAGILIDPHDVDGLAEHMRELQTDGVLSARLGLTARLRSQQFAWQKCADETMRVYNVALNKTA